MPSAQHKPPPPDQLQRESALDLARSILVHAPAGSGKTDLLTRRFLRLLAAVDEPGEIVAITFTKAAAAEMRHRILRALEEAGAAGERARDSDVLSMRHLATRALAHSQAQGWNLLDLPAQLRIQTIDSFGRELALQQPLISGMGGSLDIFEQPAELYRRAARRTLEQIDDGDARLREAIAALLLWRDNSWQDLENQLVAMLGKRDQWMRDFTLDRDPDWEALRAELERPFARQVRRHLTALSRLLGQVPGARDEAHSLARFACGQCGGALYRDLAELAAFPEDPFETADQLDEAYRAYLCVVELLLTGGGAFRQQVDVHLGFPREFRAQKARALALITGLRAVPGLESALAGVRRLPSVRYSDEDWEIVKASFTLLRHAAGELKVVFAEAAAADFIEVALIALNVLKGEDELPAEGALGVSDRIRHLLVDEFQDTSRRQHQLLAHLIAAWPGREGRTLFVVGDPLQSIYGFRDADAELFPRVEQLGLEIPGDLPLRLDPLLLTANFRSAEELVAQINQTFGRVFEDDDGSGLVYEEVEAARADAIPLQPRLLWDEPPGMRLHVEFMPEAPRANAGAVTADEKKRIQGQRDGARDRQVTEIVDLIRAHLPKIEEARAKHANYRVAVLGRARTALEPVAQALREAEIPFRAVKMEELRERPEIIDALALARALLGPEDRVAWLGVLRAPWCGLSLADLHTLASTDDAEILARPMPQLMTERAALLSGEGRAAVERLLRAAQFARRLRAAQPAAATGTWLEQVWLRLGGAHCVDATQRANLDLLWRSLDRLPQGEPDLLGTALDAALADLKAQPDPNSDSDCGVQLMTIHGAKGLEFEVVIVPELQAQAGNNRQDLLSWQERGVTPAGDDGDEEDEGAITEFLVAPVQSKGTERGQAKKWVDSIRRERERQETRRLFYVAATRAREELHLFARPSYKTAQDGVPALVRPLESLLKTAWPALGEEIQRRFAAWRVDAAAAAQPLIVTAIAAGRDANNIEMLAPAKRTRMRRLPAQIADLQVAQTGASADIPLVGMGSLYERHEGGLRSRLLGKAVHALLEELARTVAARTGEAPRVALARVQPRVAAEIRAAGVEPAQADRITVQATQIALEAAADPKAQWILAPHADAGNEVRWTGVVDGSLRTVQVDRVFRAGAEPGTPAAQANESTWWIIDYKTAHEEGLDPATALPQLRRMFAPQVEAYGKILRNLHGMDTRVCAGLYYPRMAQFDWWEM